MIASKRIDYGILVQRECGRGLDEEWYGRHDHSGECELVAKIE